MFAKLTDPLILSEDYESSIQTAYDYFNEKINNRSNRPALFEKELFIEANETIEGRPVGFWHIISLEESHHFKVLPCINDVCMELCGENCELKNHQVSIKLGTETRNICLLRASRLPWILDLIKLANRDDPAVKIWKRENKLYIRYNHFGNDFVLILSDTKHFYRIISAYPVFYTKDKKVFDRDSVEFAWSYFK